MHISNCPYLRLTRSIYASSNKSSILSFPCLYIAAFHDVWRVEVVFGWRLGFILSIQTIYTLDVSHSKSLIFIIIVVVVVVFIKFNSLRETSKVHMDIHLYAGWLVVVSNHQHHYSSSSHILIFVRQTHRDGRTDGLTNVRPMYVCIYVYTATHLPNVIVSMLLQVPVSL